MFGDFGADDIEHDECDNGRERGVDGAHERLGDTVSHDNVEGLAVADFRRDTQVLAHSVEDDNGVMDREAEDNEKRGHEKRIYFIARIVTKDSEDTGGNEYIM